MAEGRLPLRVGLLLDGWEQPAWVYRMLKIIKQSGYADIALVVLNGAAPAPATFTARLRKDRGILLYRLYVRLENLVCRPRPDAFRPRNTTDLLSEVESFTALPEQKGPWDTITQADVDRIRAASLDVLVHLGFRLIDGGILESAGHGVWSFHHGDNRVLRGGPPGFWEVFDHHPLTGSILQVLKPDVDNGYILARSWSSTNRFAVRNSRNKYFWKTLSLLPRKLRDLHDLGKENFYALTDRENPPLTFYDRPLYRPPRNWAFLKAFTRHFLRSAGAVIPSLLHREDWILMYHFNDGLSKSFRRYRKLLPPKDRFWADPHAVEKGGRYYIFMEEWIYPGTKGHISLIIMDEDGSTEGPHPVLEQPWHLAYPMIFRWKGSWYMVPDSAANSTVDVYRCEDFPRRWTFHKTLMKDIRAVDPTVFHHGDKWWLFAAVKEQPGASYSDELFLFSADHPLSDDWRPHPRNPVVSDASRARPAGRILEHEGKMYRVSQNCSRGYGYGMNFHEIVTLDEDRYAEKNTWSVEPLWNPKVRGMHTFSRTGRLTVIDAKVRSRRFL